MTAGHHFGRGVPVHRLVWRDWNRSRADGGPDGDPEAVPVESPLTRSS